MTTTTTLKNGEMMNALVRYVGTLRATMSMASVRDAAMQAAVLLPALRNVISVHHTACVQEMLIGECGSQRNRRRPGMGELLKCPFGEWLKREFPISYNLVVNKTANGLALDTVCKMLQTWNASQKSERERMLKVVDERIEKAQEIFDVYHESKATAGIFHFRIILDTLKKLKEELE